jgi:nitrogen fixation/metabolism regulation signal transduction histidine kinase
MNYPDHYSLSKYLTRISEATTRMANLNARLTAYARCGKYQPKVLFLSRLIKASLDQMPHILRPGILIKTLLHHDDGIMADTAQMKLVFSALFRNAAETMETSGEIFIETGKTMVAPENISRNHAFKNHRPLLPLPNNLL